MKTSGTGGCGGHPLGAGVKNQVAGHCIVIAFSAFTVLPPFVAVSRKLIVVPLSAVMTKIFVPVVGTTCVSNTAPVMPLIRSNVTFSASVTQVTVTDPPTCTMSGMTVKVVMTGITVGDGVSDGVRVGRGVRVIVGVRLGVSVGVIGVSVNVGVKVRLGVSVDVAVSDGIGVNVGVLEGVIVLVGVWEGVTLGVSVFVGVRVIVGVLLGVSDGKTATVGTTRLGVQAVSAISSGIRTAIEYLNNFCDVFTVSPP